MSKTNPLKIHSTAFEIIHDLIGEKHFKSLTATERGHHTSFSPELWSKKRNGVRLIAEAVRPFSNSYNTIKLTRQRIREESKIQGFGAVADILMISLLRYLDFKTGIENLDRDIFTLVDFEAKEIAEILFDQFVKDKYPLYHKNHPDITPIPSLDISALLLIANQTETQKIERKIKSYSANDDGDYFTQSDFTTFVLTYLENIKNERTIAAFDNWLPDSRKKIWDADLSKFEKHGFYKVISRSDISIFDVKVFKGDPKREFTHSAECKIYFAEEIMVEMVEVVKRIIMKEKISWKVFIYEAEIFKSPEFITLLEKTEALPRGEGIHHLQFGLRNLKDKLCCVNRRRLYFMKALKHYSSDDWYITSVENWG